MTQPISYTVRFTLDDQAVADEWLAWHRNTHMAELAAVGAKAQHIVRIDPDDGDTRVAYESRCLFAARDAWDRYLRQDTPRFQAESFRRFTESRGVTQSRSVGEVVEP